MIRSHLLAFRISLMAADAVSGALAFGLASWIKFGPERAITFGNGLRLELPIVAAAFGITWVVGLWAMGYYQMRARLRLRAEARVVLRATVVVTVGAMAALYVLGASPISRVFLIVLFVVAPTATLALRALVRRAFVRLRRRGYDAHYAAVVGTGELARWFVELVRRREALGLHVVGFLTVPGEPAGVMVSPMLGPVTALSDVFRRNIIDELILCLDGAGQGWQEPLTRQALEEGKIVRVVLGPDNEVMAGPDRESIDGMVIESTVVSEQRAIQLAAKRLLDIIGATVGLVVLSPVLLITTLTLLVFQGGPILFRQVRVGRHGRTFTMLKFRTMVNEAESMLDDVRAKNQIAGPALQLVDDPRVTRIGRFLRGTSIDELPQLWNVLRGSMSLVGPRPAPLIEVVDYEGWHRRRLAVKPGLTGLAQVKARRYKVFDDRATLDIRYIETWSLWSDVRILLSTVVVVLLRTGQ